MAWLARRITTRPRLAGAVLAWFAVLVGLGVGAGALLENAEGPDGSTAIDRSITTWAVTHRTAALTSLAHVFSTLGSQAVLIPVVGVVTVILLARRRLLLAGVLVIAWGGSQGLYHVIKPLVDRMRPPRAIWLTNVGRTASFPSGHATQSLATFAALGLVCAVLLPRVRWPVRVAVVVLAAGVGWSRVYLGVHWTTDVAAGWLLAAAWLVGLVALARVAPARTSARPGAGP